MPSATTEVKKKDEGLKVRAFIILGGYMSHAFVWPHIVVSHKFSTVSILH